MHRINMLVKPLRCCSKRHSISFCPALPDLWPSNSPNLNPVDYNYMVWGVMQHHVYQSRVNTVDKLKECLTAVWYISARTLLAVSLTIKHKRLILLTCRLAHVSISRSVCLSGKCIVATQLNGSGCCLGW